MLFCEMKDVLLNENVGKKGCKYVQFYHFLKNDKIELTLLAN